MKFCVDWYKDPSAFLDMTSTFFDISRQTLTFLDTTLTFLNIPQHFWAQLRHHLMVMVDIYRRHFLAQLQHFLTDMLDYYKHFGNPCGEMLIASQMEGPNLILFKGTNFRGNKFCRDLFS